MRQWNISLAPGLYQVSVRPCVVPSDEPEGHVHDAEQDEPHRCARLPQVVLTSEIGLGWISSTDAAQNCCNLNSNPAVTGCCPRVELKKWQCNKDLIAMPTTLWGERRAMRSARAFVQQHHCQACTACPLPKRPPLADERANFASNASYFNYQKRYGFRLCGGGRAPPSTATERQYFQYPLEQRGVYLHSYELQVNVNSTAPAPRQRWAPCTLLPTGAHAELFRNRGDTHWGHVAAPAPADGQRDMSGTWAPATPRCPIRCWRPPTVWTCFHDARACCTPLSRHAVTFLSDDLIKDYIGVDGALVIYGGTTSVNASEPNKLLSDLWCAERAVAP